jgi:hypothetical protein
MKKKYGFFSPGTMDTSDHGAKNDPKGSFELYPNLKNFPQKSNQDRVANNDFDLLWRKNKIRSF